MIVAADIQYGTVATTIVGMILAGAAVSTRLAARRVEISTGKAAANLLERDRITAEVAADVAQSQERQSQLIVDSNNRVNETIQGRADTQDEQLLAIHTLVNSSMTAAMQGELEAVEAQLVVMRELAEVRKAAGEAPTPVLRSAMAATEARQRELAALLANRLRAQQTVDQQGVDRPPSPTSTT